MLGLLTLQGTGTPLNQQEVLDHGAHLDPGVRIVAFEYEAGDGLLDRLLDHDGKSTHGHVAVLIVVARQGARTPDLDAAPGEAADHVHRLA